MSGPEVHKALAPIDYLIGTWRGRGAGAYPTIDDFSYDEELDFWHTGRPWLAFVQKTRSPEGAPMHSEMGYLRPQKDGGLEAVIAHAFGVVETLTGDIDGARIDLASRSLISTPSAKTIARTHRTFELKEGVLTYELEMEYGDNDLQHHLSARLERES